MRTYEVTVTVHVRAESPAAAHRFGESAAQHLLETFNDNGSIDTVFAQSSGEPVLDPIQEG